MQFNITETARTEEQHSDFECMWDKKYARLRESKQN